MVIKRLECKRAALILEFKSSKKMLKCNCHKCNVGYLKRNARKTKYTFEKLPVMFIDEKFIEMSIPCYDLN